MKKPTTKAPPAFQPLVSHFKPGKSTYQLPSATLKGKEPLKGAAAYAVSTVKNERPETATRKAEVAHFPFLSGKQVERMPPPTRATTPPPTQGQPTQPPRTPTGPRTATLPSPDLFEPLQRSPVSVRTDPDSGKMYLLLSPGRGAQPRSMEPRRKRERSGASLLGEGHGLGIYKEEEKRDLASPRGNEVSADQNDARRKRNKSTHTYPSEDRFANPFLGLSATSSPTLSSSPRFSQNNNGSACVDYIQPAPAADLVGKIRGNRSLALAPQIASLYALHAAIEHSLVVHLATMGTGGSPINHSAVDGSISIPHLITFSALRPLVEKSSGRRLASEDLSRLLWIWKMKGEKDIGLTVSTKRVIDPLRSARPILDYSVGICIRPNSSISDEDDGITDNCADSGALRVATPPRTRTLTIEEPTSPSPSPRKRSRNEAILPARTPPQSPSSRSVAQFTSPSRMGTREGAASPRRGMNIVAMWNNGIEIRKRQVRKRLIDWSLRCFVAWHREEQSRVSASIDSQERAVSHTLAKVPETPKKRKGADPVEGLGGLWTPGKSRDVDHIAGQGRVIGSLEQEQEPEIKDTNLPSFVEEWPEEFPLERVAPIPRATLPSLELESSLSTSASSSMRTLYDRVTAPPSSASTPATTTSSEKALSGPSQPMSLTERIRAKEAAKRASTAQAISACRPMGSLSSSSSNNLSSTHSTMDDYKRRSMLSRLCDISESLYMLFMRSRQPVISSKSQQLQGEQQWRLPTLPMEQVIKAIMSSSKVSLSETEASKALELLDEVAPGFVTVATVGRGKWVRLGSRLADEEEESRTGEEKDKEEGGEGEMESETLLEMVRRRIRNELDNN